LGRRFEALHIPMVARIYKDGNVWEFDGLGLPNRHLGKIYDK